MSEICKCGHEKKEHLNILKCGFHLDNVYICECQEYEPLIDIERLIAEKARLQEAVEEARPMIEVISTFKGEKYSYLVIKANEWLIAHPKQDL